MVGCLQEEGDMQYRQREAVVDAVQWTGSGSSTDRVLDFASGFAMVQKRSMNKAGVWKVHNLSVFVGGQSYRLIEPGDYVVKDAKGRFYVYSAREFDELFEEINDQED